MWGESRQPWSVLFDDRLEQAIGGLSEAELLAGDYEHTWQVERSSFDTILLNAAVSLGAELVHGEVSVPCFEGDRLVAVELRDGGRVQADVFFDATGQRCLIGRHLRLTRQVTDLKCTATYTYYRGAGGFPGTLGRHVQWVVTTEAGWCWFIPVSADITSVGVVSRASRMLSEAEFDAAVAQAGFPVDGAEAVCSAPSAKGSDPGRLWYARDWSFVNQRFAGDNWLLLGDAACFVDPILSGGVDFAVRSGANAALAVLRHADGEDWSALGEQYDQTFRREYKAYLRLARYWYGNNRSVEGLFWQAYREIPKHATATPAAPPSSTSPPGTTPPSATCGCSPSGRSAKMFEKLGVDADALHRARER